MREMTEMELNSQERKILELVRGMEDGQLRIFMENHVPSRVEVICREELADQARCDG